jgi:hypothetical protein
VGSLSIVLAFLLSILVEFRYGFNEPLCSKRYLSPSGQQSILVEGYVNPEASRAYFDGLIFRKNLGEFGYPRLVCTETLTLKWSVDERQVDWKTPTRWKGYWRF